MVYIQEDSVVVTFAASSAFFFFLRLSLTHSFPLSSSLAPRPVCCHLHFPRVDALIRILQCAYPRPQYSSPSVAFLSATLSALLFRFFFFSSFSFRVRVRVNPFRLCLWHLLLFPFFLPAYSPFHFSLLFPSLHSLFFLSLTLNRHALWAPAGYCVGNGGL